MTALYQFYDAGIRYVKPIEAETKLPPFRRRYIRMHFLEWKCMSFTDDFTAICSWGSDKQYSIIGSDNSLAPTRREAIIWTNDG